MQYASKKCANTKAVIKRLKNKIKAPLLQLRKPLLSHTINTITGHGPFREHLARMKLANETSCPYCGAVTDSHIHFIFECHMHRKIRKQMLLKIESQTKMKINYASQYQTWLATSNCLTGLVLIDARSNLSGALNTRCHHLCSD